MRSRGAKGQCGVVPAGIPFARAILALLLTVVTGIPERAIAAEEGTAPRYLRRLSLPGSADPLKQPLAVHADRHAGEIFVCDRQAGRIAIFDGRGLPKYTLRGGASFVTPLDLAADPDGYLFVLDAAPGGNVVRLLDFDGRLVRSVLLSGLPESAKTPVIVSIALSDNGERLYLLDQANFRLWIARRDGTVQGSADLVAEFGPKAAREQILGRVDVYGDTVLVARAMAGDVLLLDLDGRLKGSIGQKGTAPCETAFPVAAALDRQGNVVVLDQQRTLMMVWRPSDDKCLREFATIGSSPGALYQPADLTLDAGGLLYVGQGFQGRVQVFDYGVPAPEISAPARTR